MPPKPSSIRRSKAKPPQVPGYVVGEEIGRGAMGIVYRATQKIVDREVALKVLHPEHSNTPRLVSRLRREARTTARLAHPHVVSAIDMGETDGLWWYAMEFVDGVSLSERLKKDGKLTERTALRLLIPLCEALEHLYENGVVHRDIKPGNILISKVGGARLADLGLAFAEDDPSLTGRGGTLGTPHYISPEQAVDARRADVRSDIWSFGATLFHVVCGRPPFQGNSTAEILSAVLYAAIPEPRELTPELSKGLALVLRKCLTREVEYRYQNPGDLLRDLERVRERRMPKVRQRSLEPVEGEHGARRRWWLVAAGVVLSLGAGWWFDALGLRARDQGGAAGALRRFEPLEAFARRLPPTPENVEARLRELDLLRERLDPEFVPRWEELRAALVLWMDDRLRAAQTQSERRIEDALISSDIRSAMGIFGEHAARIEKLSGMTPAQLSALGLKSNQWAENMRERLDQERERVVSEFEAKLLEWTSNLRLDVDELVDEGRWLAAEAQLSRNLDGVALELLQAPLRLPDASMANLDQLLQTSLSISAGGLKDRWRALDREISERLRERYDQLLEELEANASPRPYASLELKEAFDEELALAHVDLTRLPSSFTVTSVGLLKQRLASLGAREAELLEADARAEIEATGSLTGALWKARQYQSVAVLWGEVLDQLELLQQRTQGVDDTWRRNLEKDCSLHRAEALLVQREVLQRAADAIVALNGKRIEKLTVAGITLTRQRVKSGLFPLIDGFRVEDFSEPIFLQELSPIQVQVFAGLGEAEALRGKRRMALASFLYHEGLNSEAGALLKQEIVLLDELEGLYWDLERRINVASDASEGDREDRVRDALEKLDYVFKSGNQLHMTNKVLLYVDSLLGELGDLEEVRSKSRRLRELQDQLKSKSKLSPKEAIRQAYQLDEEHLIFEGARDVQLDYSFDSDVVGTWRMGQWIFDALGWTSRDKVERWDELVYQNGPRLNLPAPLLTDRFELTLDIESIDGGQPQLFTLAAMGFNLALFGPGLHGDPAQYAMYVKGGRFDDFLESLETAKRLPVDELLLPRTLHHLRLVGHRATGGLRVELDGRSIWTGNLSGVRSIRPSIRVASWDRVRLSRVVLKAYR